MESVAEQASEEIRNVSSDDLPSTEDGFQFLERLPGTGPDGPRARNIELPYYSRSNGM